MFKLCCDFFKYSPGPRYFIDAALQVAAPWHNTEDPNPALIAESDVAGFIYNKKVQLNALYAGFIEVLQSIPVYSTTGLGRF